jgi:hypothetical protein
LPSHTPHPRFFNNTSPFKTIDGTIIILFRHGFSVVANPTASVIFIVVVLSGSTVLTTTTKNITREYYQQQ